jgi:O-acetyl-ADP-ribose deacetylase (regulator of RNase III)
MRSVMKVSVGNILDVTEGVIIQQVNAQGVMGSGVAKAIRDKWPVVYSEYAAVIKMNQYHRGHDFMGRVIATQVEPMLLVVSVVGQLFYGKQEGPEVVRYTSYDALDKAFTELNKLLQELPVSLHFPLLGSDLGGGHWPIVKSIIKHRLSAFDLNLWLLPGVVEPT